MDIVTSEARSKMMAGIRSKNTKPEMLVRSALHRLGFRFRLHDKNLPGSPDLVLPRYHAVIFIHGCFWHGHDCHLFRLPATRTEFWEAKIGGNRRRDKKQEEELVTKGWRIAIIRECAIKGKQRLPFPELVRIVEKWLISESQILEIRGKEPKE